jgi:glyoxylase-like metal-dependent hydrolase (beta-lactamase superfamily II)
MINVKQFETNPFGESTFVIWEPQSMAAAIIDPGMATPYEEKLVDDFIRENQLEVKALLLTHLHIDHTFGVDFAREHYNAPLYAHPDDEFLGQRRMEQAQMFHLPAKLSPISIDHKLTDDEQIQLGSETITVYHAPGHSPGSVLYYIPSIDAIFTGDLIFKGSIGRTDLPGGDYGQLIRSINNKLVDLPLSTTIYPGHGPSTTLAEELRTNPYI